MKPRAMNRDNGPSLAPGNERTIRIYDTTLRDGEQMPGVAFSLERRLAIAGALDALGIPEIECGFAASSRAHAADMAAVAGLGLKAMLLSLARPIAADIDAAALAGMDGVILVTSVSDEHLKHKLRMSLPDVETQVLAGIAHARERGLFVQVSFEDATRTPRDRLKVLATRFQARGAMRVGLADTVGVATPDSIAALVASLVGELDVPLAAHCHDDFGMAVANSLAAVQAGATALSATINGLGERAGNASTEECIMALEVLTRMPTGCRLERLVDTCRLVAEASGVPIPANKAVAGRNAFRHESGIHVAAIIARPSCYEPYSPELVGAEREVVLGKTSGRAALRHLAGDLADHLDSELCQSILASVKQRTESGQEVGTEQLRSLILDRIS